MAPGRKICRDGRRSRKRCAALAQADVGIAIGAGTDVAIETGRVVLMKSDPSDVLRVIRLSKATITKMKQNLFWASFCNILAIPIAAGILYPNFGIILRPEVSALLDRKSTRLNSSHSQISYAVFCLKKKKKTKTLSRTNMLN